jgi:pimeloyl-ACP methyl ester carboxylesterase
LTFPREKSQFFLMTQSLDGQRFDIQLNDGAMAGRAWGPADRPIDLVFLHANGFCGSTYASILAPLGDAGAHVVTLDLRGHGQSTLEANPIRQDNWNIHRNDLIAALDQIAPDGAVLAGHSMGGTSSLLVAGARPDLVKALVLVDPVFAPQGFYFYAKLPWVFPYWRTHFPMAKAALKRRASFPDRATALTAYTGRGAFKSWREPFLADYLEDGLTQQGDGFRLSCEPAFEAACFAGQRHNPWKALKSVVAPITVLRGEKFSTLRENAAHELERRGATLTTVPGTSHFIPMEKPYVVRAALEQSLALEMKEITI